MGWYDSGASSLAGMAQIAQNYKAEPNAGASIAGGIDTAVQKIKSRAEEVRLNDLRVASEGRVKELLAQPPKAGENPTQWLSQIAEAGSYLDPQKKAALDNTVKAYTMQYETDTKKLLQQEGFTHAEKLQGEQIASAEKLAEAKNKLTEKQIGVSALIANTQANASKQQLALAQEDAISKGRFYDEKTGKFYTDYEDPRYKASKTASEISDFSTALLSPIDATKALQAAKATSNWTKTDAGLADDALAGGKLINAIGTDKKLISEILSKDDGRVKLQELLSLHGTAKLDEIKDSIAGINKLLGRKQNK